MVCLSAPVTATIVATIAKKNIEKKEAVLAASEKADVTMAVLITAIWGVMEWMSNHIEKKVKAPAVLKIEEEI